MMDILFLKDTNLFRDIKQEEISAILNCFMIEEKCYEKGEVIYHAGEIVKKIGLVMNGSVCIEYDDIWGNKSILDKVDAGHVFAETYACLPLEPIMVSVVTLESTKVMFIDISKILHPCSCSCTQHRKLIGNLLTISSKKNLTLSRRIFHTTAKSIRGRLLSYLSFEATREGKHEFDIPFNRQQLADYLGVDRSALSGELGKMQREGLIIVRKNHFLLQRKEHPYR